MEGDFDKGKGAASWKVRETDWQEFETECPKDVKNVSKTKIST
jgi:hypothetical protein